MRNSIKIQMFNPGKADAELSVAVPLPMITLASQILPVRVKLFLENTGIDIRSAAELPAIQEWKGELIQIESPEGKVAISVEAKD